MDDLKKVLGLSDAEVLAILRAYRPHPWQVPFNERRLYPTLKELREVAEFEARRGA